MVAGMFLHPSAAKKESCRILAHPRATTLSAACFSLNHITTWWGRLINIVGQFPAQISCSRAASLAAKDKGLVEVGSDSHGKRSALWESLPLKPCAETFCRES